MTEWFTGVEEFWNQFIDGVVDPRIAPNLASTLVTLTLHNIKDFDPDINKLVQPYVGNLFEHTNAVAKAASRAKDPSDRTGVY